MCSRFHAFGNDIKAQHAAGSNDCGYDGQIFGIIHHVADKALIQFDRLSRELLQVSQGSITGTEIIQRHTYTYPVTGT